MDQLYYPGVSVPKSPKSMYGCSDDFVMVEFGRVIRFYYIFRPWLYSDEALLTTYKKLGVTIRADPETGDTVLDDIDFLLSGDVTGAFDMRPSIERSFFSFLAPERRGAVTTYEWANVHALMGKIQKETIGTYFGADNPFVTEPPDKLHACMPGYPDDMVNLMLFSLVGGLTSRAH
jgi:hypothetical protein